MKKIIFLSVKTFVLVLTVVLLVTGVTACGGSSYTATEDTEYKLVHNLPDLELSFPGIQSKPSVLI